MKTACVVKNRGKDIPGTDVLKINESDCRNACNNKPGSIKKTSRGSVLQGIACTRKWGQLSVYSNKSWESKGKNVAYREQGTLR